MPPSLTFWPLSRRFHSLFPRILKPPLITLSPRPPILHQPIKASHHHHKRVNEDGDQHPLARLHNVYVVLDYIPVRL